MSEILRFQPLKCIVDPTFWYLFTQKKIKDWKLSEAAIQIQGKLLISEKQPPTLLITDNAFER